jgi:hypothetical protein
MRASSENVSTRTAWDTERILSSSNFRAGVDSERFRHGAVFGISSPTTTASTSFGHNGRRAIRFKSPSHAERSAYSRNSGRESRSSLKVPYGATNALGLHVPAQ